MITPPDSESMLTLLRQRHERRKDGSEVLLSHKKVLWSMFMLKTQLWACE